MNDRLSKMAIGGLVTVAVIMDLLNWIPAIGSIVTAIGWVALNVFFYLKGISVFSGKKLATNLASITIGLIPVLEVLPETTVGIIAIIMFVKAEDKLGVKIPTTASIKPSISPK